MNLITVQCSRSKYNKDDVEPRTAVVIANDHDEAVELCKTAYARDGFDHFEVHTVFEKIFPGPRLLGYTGQGPFTWGRPD